MEPGNNEPSPVREYGTIVDPAQRAQQSEAAESTHLLHKHRPTSARRRKEWLALAVICGVGIGTIMAANRDSLPGMGDTSLVDTSAVHGSLLADRLPAGAVQDRASEQHNSSFKPPVKREMEPTVKQTQQHAQHPTVEISEDDEIGDLAFSITNFYHTRDGKPGAMIPWLRDVKLAEPYMDTTLTVATARDGFSYRWEIRNPNIEEKDREVLARAEGAETTMQFTVLDHNMVVLKEVEDVSGSVVRTLVEDVMVKYVRREIRTLTDDDRNELLDAMLILWTVSRDDGGKELYGEDYADIFAINRLHFRAAGPADCDHFHDGLGFLTSHSTLTNTFEYSMQRVNPKLTVPYWDFTIESSSTGNTDGEFEPQANSPLLSPDWFGSHDPEDKMVKNGRWAYTEVPRVNANNPGNLETDVYSKLRAPWNVNDRAYLTRGLGEMCVTRTQSGYPWPTCETHYSLNMDYNDFYSWVWQGLYHPHGPVHVWLGGVVDCEDTYSKIADLVGGSTAERLSYYSYLHRKNLYRSGDWTCEGQADPETKPYEVFESKQCGCLGYNLESGDDYTHFVNEMLNMDVLIGGYDQDVQRQVIALLCSSTINDGDHLQASSSLDPTFWVTHPTMERLWMFKRLTGTMTDLTWPDSDYTYTDENGISMVEVLSLSGDSCTGHAGSDVFPFGFGADEGSPDFKTRTEFKHTGVVKELANRQLLQMMDPRVNGLSYIYDTFEWAHCAADGYEFNDVFNSNDGSSKGTRPAFKASETPYPLYSTIKQDRARATQTPKV